jgi:hypothetical protein
VSYSKPSEKPLPLNREGQGLFSGASKSPNQFNAHTRPAVATQSLEYAATQGDEVEDLRALLAAAARLHGAQAVSCGAIASDYQRLRVESVCASLGLVSLGFLWRVSQRVRACTRPASPVSAGVAKRPRELISNTRDVFFSHALVGHQALLRAMYEAGVEAVFVKVAALGLLPDKHLGKNLQQMEPVLHRLHRCVRERGHWWVSTVGRWEGPAFKPITPMRPGDASCS